MAECKDEDALTSSFRSCANDPDFAVICAFLQKFSKDLGLDFASFKQLQEWLTNTDEVSNQLRDLHIKLLRKTRKTVHEKSWESSLSKFCFTYSAQDAWEVERFGYKKSGLKVKLRIFRELLESQFERNIKFRAKVLTGNADCLRSEPIGRDRLGHSYWLTQDNDCNLRIYQEHLDEEIWHVVATNRDEFVNLIARLRGNEVVLPSSDIGVIDEDSSSNSCTAPVEKPPPPEERDDSQEEEAKIPNLRIKLGNGSTTSTATTTTITTTIKNAPSTIDACREREATVVKASPTAHTEDKIEVEEVNSEKAEKKEEPSCEGNEAKSSHKKVKPLLISQAKLAGSNTQQNPKKRTLEEIDKSPPAQDEQNTLKRPRPTLLDSKRAKKPSRYEKRAEEYEEDDDEDDEDDDNDTEDEEDDDEEVDEDEQEDEDDDDDANDDGGEEEGEEEDIDSAAAEEDENEEKEIEEDDNEDEVGEAIEEKTLVVRGEGSGAKCNSGNHRPHTFYEEQQFPFDFDLDADVHADTYDPIVSDAIEEQVFYVIGAGGGSECYVGNTKNETSDTATATVATTTPSASVEPQATFFFGQPGCLKLSPMKQQAPKTDLFKMDEMEKPDELDNSNVTSNEMENKQSPVSNQQEEETTKILDNNKNCNKNAETDELKLLKNCKTNSQPVADNHLESNGGNGVLETDKKPQEETRTVRISTPPPVLKDEKTETVFVPSYDEHEIIPKNDDLLVTTLEPKVDNECDSVASIIPKSNQVAANKESHSMDTKSSKLDEIVNANKNESVKDNVNDHINETQSLEDAETSIAKVEGVQTINPVDDSEHVKEAKITDDTKQSGDTTQEGNSNKVQETKQSIEATAIESVNTKTEEFNVEVAEPTAELADNKGAEQPVTLLEEKYLTHKEYSVQEEVKSAVAEIPVMESTKQKEEQVAVLEKVLDTKDQPLTEEIKPVVVAPDEERNKEENQTKNINSEETKDSDKKIEKTEQSKSDTKTNAEEHNRNPTTDMNSTVETSTHSGPNILSSTSKEENAVSSLPSEVISAKVTSPVASPLSSPPAPSSPLLSAPASHTSPMSSIVTTPLEIEEKVNSPSEEITEKTNLTNPAKTCTEEETNSAMLQPASSKAIMSKASVEMPHNAPATNNTLSSVVGLAIANSDVTVATASTDTLLKPTHVLSTPTKDDSCADNKTIMSTPNSCNDATSPVESLRGANEIMKPEIQSSPTNPATVSRHGDDSATSTLSTKTDLSTSMCPPLGSIKSLSIETNTSDASTNMKPQPVAPATFTAMNVSAHPNRKRRLADFIAPPQHQSTSESELDVARPEEELITVQGAAGEEPDDDLCDVGGGKRLKMRPKCTNVELRKKVEAQKTAIEETTSSSGEEDLRRRRKIITPRKQVDKSLTNKSPKRDESIIEPLPPKIPADVAKVKDVFTPTKSLTSTFTPMPSAVSAVVHATTPITKPHKPTLAEIIEKKLKKTPEKSATTSSDATSSGVENALLTFSPPKKSPITKPLKKNLLTQMRQEESDEEAIPRKRTISETIAAQGNTELRATKGDELPQPLPLPLPSPALIRKTPERKTPDRKTPDRKTPERQRKRRSSEEVKPLADAQAQETADVSDGVSEKLKKNDEVSSGETASIKAEPKTGEDDVKPAVTVATIATVHDSVVCEEKSTGRESTPPPPPAQPVEITPLSEVASSVEAPPPVIGRRSGRRGGAQVVYSELPQPKRTRGGAAKVATSVAVKKPESKSVPVKMPLDVTKKEKTPAKSKEVKEKSASTMEKVEAKNEIKTPKKEKTDGKDDKAEKQLPVAASAAATAVATNKQMSKENVKTEIVKAEEEGEKSVPTPTPTPTQTATPISKAKATAADAKTEETSPTTDAAKTTARNRGGSGGRRNREVDTSNIIEVSDASEVPVRQSRRIALQKIREEAERRKLEEIALRSMKQELKKKKKAEKQADPTVVEPSEHSSSSDEESEVEKKKRVKKKCPGKNGSWSSGSEEQEEPEEEDEEPPHYESDPGSPLFKSDHEFSPESDLEDDAQQTVPMKRARTARKEDDDAGEDVCDEQACQKCGKSDHPEWILLCDSCDKGYHCSCLSPVLFYIPEGDWHCPPCQQDQLIVALEQQLKQFDELVERKRLAAEEAQRLLAEEAQRAELARLEEEKERLERKARKKEKRGSGDSDASSDDDDEDDERLSVLQRRRNGEESKDDLSTRKSSKKSRREGGEKKRRRGDGRSRRRAAARGDRRRRRHRTRSSGSESGRGGGSGSESGSGTGSSSGSSSSSSSSATDSDDEPIYKLRKRRQINVSYRLNEYDDLINSALKKEMDEVAGAGNLGRGKDITTIIEADKEEKARQRHLDEDEEAKLDGDGAAGDDAAAKDDAKSQQPKTDAAGDEDDDDDDEPIKRKAKPMGKQTVKKKPRKLTTLDISSEEDNASDEDFKTSSFDDDEDEEEDTSVSVSSNSDSSLEIFRRRGKGGHKKQRKAARRAARERRKDRRFVVDESDDEEEEQTHSKSKKKRKDDSDYTESETSADGDEEELSDNSENVDSADLCDDTTSEDSDGAWQPSKRKKQRKSQASGTAGGGGGGSVGVARKSPKLKKPQTKKPKRVEYSDDDISESEEEEDDEDDYVGVGSGKGASGKQPRSQPLKLSESEKGSAAAGGGSGGGGGGSGAGSGKGKGKGKAPANKKKKKKCSAEEEDSYSDSGDSARRTRGRRYAYLEDFDDDSSDGGIKPGVKRPDTPPEERQKFIERQEEIKRMLAAKNAEGAKIAATPRLTPIKGQGQGQTQAQAQALDKDKRSPAKPSDSLSTVPLSVIRQAKVLDIDYLQRKGEQVGDLDNVEDVESEFDDADLPDDLPEDMDEDDIARMVDEEEFGATATAAAAAAAATRDPIPAADEITIRNAPTTPATPVAVTVTGTAATATTASITIVAAKATAKVKEPVPSALPPTTIVVPQKPPPPPPAALTTNPSLAALSAMPTPSGLQEPLRKRLPMPTLHPPLLRHQYPPAHLNLPPAHLLQRHAAGTVPPSTHLLQNALSAPLGQPLSRSFPTTPAQLLAPRMPGLPGVVTATTAHLLPPHLLPAAAQTLAPSQPQPQPQTQPQPQSTPSPLHDAISDDGKPRGRRKKITPLRDALQKQQTAAAASASTTTITSGGEKSQTTSTVAVTSLSTTIVPGGVIKSAMPAAAPAPPISAPHVAPPAQIYKLPGAAPPPGGEATPSPQPSVITRMPHLPPGRSGAGGPPTSIYAQSPDVLRFYGPGPGQQSLTGARPPPPQAHSQPSRHRLPLQMGGLPPPPQHHGMRPTYGPPPPLRGSPSPNLAPSLLPPSAAAVAAAAAAAAASGVRGVYVPSTQASDLHATQQQLNAVYGGAPPPARSTAPHLNPYRQHIYGNPNYAPPPRGVPPSASNLRTGPPPHAADYVAGARVYPPYSYYPPPPPLTAHQSVVPPPGAHSTLASAPSSVIVSAPPAAAAANISTSTTARVITKSPSPSVAALNIALNKSPLALGGESSGSRSSPGMQADAAEDSSSAPAASNATTVTATTGSEGQASEFSGLVSYFSSQHDDYNS